MGAGQGVVINSEWVVLVEAADEFGQQFIDLQELNGLLSELGDDNVSALYHPRRYAIQLKIVADDPAKAVSIALSRWSEAVRRKGLPSWNLARVEVVTPTEFARELESEEGGPERVGDRSGTEPSRAAAADVLLSRAFRDPLTGLVTRELFLDRVNSALAHSGERKAGGTLLVLDIDGFAGVNRDFGHIAGDRVLMVVADRLSQIAGPGAEVARVGSNAYAVFVSSGHSPHELGARVLAAVPAPVKVPGGTVSVTASVGIASTANSGDADELLHNASVAMCAAKASGGNRRKGYVPGLVADTSRLDDDPGPVPDRLSYVLLLARAASAANEELDLPGAATLVLQQVCAHTDWVAGQLTEVTLDGSAGQAPLVWYASVPQRFETLRLALNRRQTSDPTNLVSEVLKTAGPALITDTSACSSPWARAAVGAGIRAACAFPVRVGQQVVGVLEWFSARPVEPDGSLMEVLTSVGIELGRIVERRRARAALAESEANYRSLSESLPLLVRTAGPDGKVTYVNRRWLEFTGRRLDEELGDGWIDGIHLDDLSTWRARYRTALDRGEPFEITYRLRRADGDYRWVVDRGSPLWDGGRFRGFVGGAVDVTERYRAEQEARRSHARLRALLDNAGASIVVLDAGGAVVEEHLGSGWSGYRWNGAGRIGFESVHPDDRVRLAEVFDDVRSREGRCRSFECRMRAEDGSWRLVEAVVDNQLGNPDLNGILVTVIDIDERRQLDVVLTRSQAQAHDAEGMTRVGTWRHDLSTGGSTWSPGLPAILGIEPDGGPAGLGPDLEAVHPDDRARLAIAIEQARHGVAVAVEEFRLIRSDGQVSWYRCRTSPERDEAGTVTAVVGMVQEITHPVLPAGRLAAGTPADHHHDPVEA